MEVKKVYYSMQEVMELTSLPASTLRYWEKQFKQLAPRKDKHLNRYYTEEDIEFIKQVKFIRDDLKITRIEAIQNKLKESSGKISHKQKTKEILQIIRNDLVEIRSMI
jgi:DNA-binding transcriptional MerR regulator